MTVSEPPVWLLDVDGVVNATRPGWGGPPRRAHVTAGGHEWQLRWEPKLIGCIRMLHMAAVVEVRWCTTWCPWADTLERLWQLPTLGRAFAYAPTGMRATYEKADAARKVLADGRRLVWTDDEVVPEPGDPLHEELTAYGQALLIRPSARRGLRPEHLHEIERFARPDPGC